MHGIRNEHQFLVFRAWVSIHHGVIGIFSHVAGMCLLPVNDEHSRADLIHISEDGLIQIGQGADGVPALVGVEGAGMIGPSLVVCTVIFHEEGRIFRDRKRQATAGTSIVCAAIDGGAGRTVLLPQLMTRFFTVRGIEISSGGRTAQIIHGRDDRGFDPGVDGCRIQCQTAPAADSKDTDLLWIHVVLHTEEIHGCLKVFGIDVGRCAETWVPSTLAGKRGIERDGVESSFRKRLRIETGALFLYRSEGTADGYGRKPARHLLWRILVRGQRDAITVDESDLFMIDVIAFGKGLIPLLCQIKDCRFQHISYLLLHKCCCFNGV